MSRKVNIDAIVETTPLTVAVAAAPGGAGTAVAYATASSRAILTNTSRACAVQYKVGTGTWQELEVNQGMHVDIDMSTTSLYLRRATLDGGPAELRLVIEGVPQLTYGAKSLVDGGGNSRIKAALLSGYEAQQKEDVAFGPQILPRVGYPVAANIPMITGITGVPSADADAASQVIYVFGSNFGTVDPIPATNLEKSIVRSYSESIRARGFFGVLRLSESLSLYGQNDSQDIDPGTNYGLTNASNLICDFFIDSDVLFFPAFSGGNGIFEFYVDGSLCLPTAGSGISLSSDGRTYGVSANGYVKMKWSTVARRRVTLLSTKNFSPSSLHTRAVSTITPAVPNPIHWGHLGGSFSRGEQGVTSNPRAITHWMHRAFGLQVDFINAAQGSTGFSGGFGASLLNIPGAVPVVGQKLSLRQQYRLNLKGCTLDLVTILMGINDAPASQPLMKSELTSFLQEIALDKPSCKVFIFSSESSPNSNVSGDTLISEDNVAVVCAGFPNVAFFRLQSSRYGPFLRGTGFAGSTNGSGNTDVYTSADTLHPTDAGARAYGQMMALRLYDYLRLS